MAEVINTRTCKVCGLPIVGAKGDWFHMSPLTPNQIGDMQGPDGHLAEPTVDEPGERYRQIQNEPLVLTGKDQIRVAHLLGKARPPDQILHDVDQLDTSFVDDPNINIRMLVWEIIEDVRSSYRLAMARARIATADNEEIETAVTDYLVNHWGDD